MPDQPDDLPDEVMARARAYAEALLADVMRRGQQYVTAIAATQGVDLTEDQWLMVDAGIAAGHAALIEILQERGMLVGPGQA